MDTLVSRNYFKLKTTNSFEEGRILCKIKNKNNFKTRFNMKYDYKTCTNMSSV